MVLEDELYFTIDSLETQLRSCFDYEEMWNVNFKAYINKMTEIPEGYEAIVAPRSSTFKNFGIIQTNSIGIIDNSYSGDGDIWMMPVLAMRDTEIHVNDRICQFRLLKNQDNIDFDEVIFLEGPNRGGLGSSGKN